MEEAAWISALLIFWGLLYARRAHIAKTEVIAVARAHEATDIVTGQRNIYVNVTNNSVEREIVVTHVWLDNNGIEIPLMNGQRVLPARLRAGDSWETWVAVTSLPDVVRDTPFERGRVRLSSGIVLETTRNRNVPAAGFVPGGRP